MCIGKRHRWGYFEKINLFEDIVEKFGKEWNKM